MTKFISVKVFRGTFPKEERLEQFSGQPGACFRVATEDDDHVKCFHVSEPPFDVKHLEDPNKVRGFVYASLVLNSSPDVEMELLGAEVVAEYKITEAENGDSKIERIK
ncbi:hypothetical protein ACSOR1_003193 [Escherichia coli]|uniref:hypothetical protein n=1 Tax=Escherichia coli TaxID=562 RepID=UPI0009919433|nr:hypothetical protein [Escherichia coli]AQW17589.1 hypothetical protein BE937_13695 [Escherichia coli]ASO87921.1 hypothetical protein AKO63_1445 [Escherichia coli]MCO0410584.1 hypothetical protein [Escherichia coli]HAZ3895861.1 hypothetical protein [Escherichia coli]HAZ3913916.1 hypothetical protein [Escherichia coli]